MPAAAQDTPEWRYWFAADGLRESYSRVLGTHPGGGVAVRHGATHTLDLLDGYDVSGMPEARVELDVDWENVAPSTTSRRMRPGPSKDAC